ncbi:hypothetical protein F3Y22_tig00110764pilonHSYRG00075 [Hibiscus syriacus]|uniref:Agenet domain-containing protein n=1 Tax=Hibiscus syriacus TaxID=106335 RepID=A0A6A2ZU16_HIBSY|nr:hypothetical protein F3Y22_tig00110764pilonHSYRG00075 [Hibiscus syriacus]
MSTNVCKLRYHHGGKLLRTPKVQYINGSEVEYDEDIDCICYWTVLGAVKSLGYDIGMAVKVYYVEEGKSLDGGLKLILDDKGVLEMSSQQPIEGSKQSVSQGSETFRLPPTPRFDDSDTNLERDENQNEGESGEDLAVCKEVSVDKKDDKILFSLGKHLSLETHKTRTMEGDIDAELILSEGREVEVASDEEGLRGVWFTCTILKLPEGKTKDKVLVRYKHLLEDDNQTPLTESVELSFIRPLPPVLKTPGDEYFEINDVVDAFHLDGWWTGSISEVIDNLKRYIVSFTDPPEEIEFSSSNLRPHWKWAIGRWVKPSKFQDVSSSDCQKLELSCNIAKDAEAIIQIESPNAVKSRSKKHELYCVTSKKNKMSPLMASKEPAKNKQVRQTSPKGDATPLHPSRKFKHEVPSSDCQKLELSCNIVKYAEANIQLESPDAVKNSSKKHELCRVTSKKNKMSPSVAFKEPAKSKQVRQTTPKGDATSLHPSKKFKHEMNLQKEHGMNRHQKEDGLLESRQPKSVLRITRSPPVDINTAGVPEEMVPEDYKATEAESSVISGLEGAGSRTMSIERAYSQRKISKVAGESGRVLHEKEEQPQIICHGNDSGYFPPGCENQWNDPKEKPLELMVQSPLVGLSVMPQNPHFQPLVKSKEILREGLAVAHMLNFTSLVQKTSELTVVDPRNLLLPFWMFFLNSKLLG